MSFSTTLVSRSLRSLKIKNCRSKVTRVNFWLSYQGSTFVIFGLRVVTNRTPLSTYNLEQRETLPPVDFLGSNYPNIKFSSRNSKFSDFDTLAFFSTNVLNWVTEACPAKDLEAAVNADVKKDIQDDLDLADHEMEYCM